MKITHAGVQPPALRRTGAARAPASSGFATALAAESLPTAAGSETQHAAGAALVDALLAAQEMPDALAERRKARARGETILQRLDDIRLGLLAGAIPVGRLTELARTVRDHRDQIMDPELREILNEIELRAEVELAKLGLDAGL